MQITTGLSEPLTPKVRLKISHRCAFLGEAQFFPGPYRTSRPSLPKPPAKIWTHSLKPQKEIWVRECQSDYWSCVSVAIKISLVPKGQMAVPLCLGILEWDPGLVA